MRPPRLESRLGALITLLASIAGLVSLMSAVRAEGPSALETGLPSPRLLEQVWNSVASGAKPREPLRLEIAAAGKRYSLDESAFADLRFTSRSGAMSVSIASGGNVKSFKLGTTEFVPPQSNWFSQYVDDVFQIILTRQGEGRKRREGGFRSGDPFFIHQGGSYANRAVTGSRNRYSPVLAYEIDKAGQSLFMLSWPQQGHVPDRLRSDFLLLTRINRASDAMLAFDTLIFNFGKEQIDFVNAPWGGVRSSVTGKFALYSRGEPRVLESTPFSAGAKEKIADPTARYLWHGTDSNSAAFAVVAAGERNGRTTVRYGFASGPGGPEQRDFMVATTNASVAFGPGQVLRIRYYLGAGRKNILEDELKTFNGAPIIEVLASGFGEGIKACHDAALANSVSQSGSAKRGANPGKCTVEASTAFGPGKRPLFVFNDRAGKQLAVSDDLYFGVPRDKDLQIAERAWIPRQFLGFATELKKGDACRTVGDAAATAATTQPLNGRASGDATNLVCAAR